MQVMKGENNTSENNTRAKNNPVYSMPVKIYAVASDDYRLTCTWNFWKVDIYVYA